MKKRWISLLLCLAIGPLQAASFDCGKRRVIEYFMSPLLQYGDESLRER